MRSPATTSRPGTPLAPWTYTNAELFELEYRAFFLRRWQCVGHVNDLPDAGDYVAASIGRDGVFVIRDKEGELRAFQNVCRHRASRIFADCGNSPGVIRCPYHGWTYRHDGSLMAIPQEQNFPTADRASLGLHPLSLEVFHGLLFVRMRGDGPGVEALFGDAARYFADYGVENYVRCGAPVEETWNVNWKVAWDNYLENYHIPIGHPGLYRLVSETDECGENEHGMSYGTFELKEKPSSVEQERRYQELASRTGSRAPAGFENKWVQFGLNGNLGIDLYPEMLDLFQLLPGGTATTTVRAMFYGPPDPTPVESELRQLNRHINSIVNEEDRELCRRVQLGITSDGYRPGPLSTEESTIGRFHDMVRRLVPVSGLDSAPPPGTVAAENARLAG